MTAWQDAVRAFHRLIGAPVGPAEPELRGAELRARYILEEAMEVAAGLVGRCRAAEIAEEFCKGEKYRKLSQKPDVTEVVDGLCDLTYVTLGTAEAVGVDLDKYFAVVHEANMKKTPVSAMGKRGVEGADAAKPVDWEDPKIRIKAMLAKDALAARDKQEFGSIWDDDEDTDPGDHPNETDFDPEF